MAELDGATPTLNELLSDANTGDAEAVKDTMVVATVLEVDGVADSGQQPHADSAAIIRAPSASGSNNPVAQTKRFTTVNINKKFLEKTSSSGTSQTSSSSVSAKTGGPVCECTVLHPRSS
jgi:serine/arginine repetitive matrix protein 2